MARQFCSKFYKLLHIDISFCLESGNRNCFQCTVSHQSALEKHLDEKSICRHKKLECNTVWLKKYPVSEILNCHQN